MAGSNTSAVTSVDSTPAAVSRPSVRTVGMPERTKVVRAAAMASPEMSTPRPVSFRACWMAAALAVPCASSW